MEATFSLRALIVTGVDLPDDHDSLCVSVCVGATCLSTKQVREPVCRLRSLSRVARVTHSCGRRSTHTQGLLVALLRITGHAHDMC